MTLAEEQSSSPDAPPKAHVDPGGFKTRRRPWVAVLLAVINPMFAMLYVARGWRALGYLAASVVVAASASAFGGAASEALNTVGSIALIIVGAIDGYRRAKAWPGSVQLPWYARWPGLLSVMLIPTLGLMSVRAFVVEPFRIPARSMMPMLLVDDFILVNKSAYGLRLPFSSRRITASGGANRGDVAVFVYPENPKIEYIKRIVGVPGDRIAYIDKHLSINGQVVAMTPVLDDANEWAALYDVTTRKYREELNGHRYTILINPDTPPVYLATVRQFPYRDACEYNERGFVCTVPAGHYFTMGDNRDASSDSRYWGFVPEANLVGPAFMIWWSTGRPGRIGLRVE